MMNFINIADLVSPQDPAGRTYRQINSETHHQIAVGTLVEIAETGVRLFVVWHGRDCDMTPLYYLSHDRDDTKPERDGFRNPSWTAGYSGDGLIEVQPR